MKKILIIDDSEFMRSILKDILTSTIDPNLLSEKIDISEADGKVAALKKFREVKPDVILLDVVMKETETEGIEFIKEIQGIFDVKKIIMISSVGQSAIINECLSLGLETYLLKPFDNEKVVEAVSKALRD